MERGIDPTQAFVALQKFASSEVARFYTEIAMRDAYITQLEDRVREMEEKLNGQG